MTKTKILNNQLIVHLQNKLETVGKEFDKRVSALKETLKNKENEILNTVKLAAEKNLKEKENLEEFKKQEKLFQEDPVTVKDSTEGWEITINYASELAERITKMYDKGSGTLGLTTSLWLTNIMKRLKDGR